jgi:acetolactate synthase-1/2/3 large subunit
MIKLSDYVIDFIADGGIKHIFMLSGGGCMHLVDSAGRCNKIQYVCNLHEQACIIAADAYGQYTNNIGAALVTTGPGGTNAITGVAGAWIDSTPLLVISGQVKTSDLMSKYSVRQMGVQEVDIISMVKTITKYAITVTEPNEIRYHLEKALYLAKTGRPGPVWLDIPLDIQANMIDEHRLEGFIPEEKHEKNKALLKEEIVKIIEVLNKAERPVILGGNGIRLAKAEKDFLRLIEILKVPVLTTWKIIDLLDDNHPLFAGRPGAIGQRGANFIQQNSDLFLSIGARLDFGQTAYNHNHFARCARKIIVDIDEKEIKKLQMKIDFPLAIDGGNFIRELLKNAHLIQSKERPWLKLCREWNKKYPVILPEYREEKKHVNLYILIDILSDLLLPEDIIVPGSSGSAVEIFMQSFRVKSGQRIIFNPGLGAMGFGLPASIGACIAGEKRTICLNGDGGFQLNIQELETVKRLNLPIKFFIINNGGYSSIMTTQRNYFEGRYTGSEKSSNLTLPDILRVAEAYNIKSEKIENHIHIESKVKKILDIEGPCICEVQVSPLQATMPRVKSSVKPDGTMITLPMEDLWPFLPREEFFNNMIVPPLEESKISELI